MRTVKEGCWKGNTHKRGKSPRLDITYRPETVRLGGRTTKRSKEKRSVVVEWWKEPVERGGDREVSLRTGDELTERVSKIATSTRIGIWHEHT